MPKRLLLPEQEIVNKYLLVPSATIASLAKEFNCSPSLIRKILIKHNVPEEFVKVKRRSLHLKGSLMSLLRKKLLSVM
jgi:transposase-like protein